MEPGLYTVATPIGNMDDITVRALAVLRDADMIACEDTRETVQLLRHHGLPQKELVSYHAQSNDSVENMLMEKLHAGLRVALVSDRGTPGISDPGNRLITRARSEGVRVIPIPGATALIAALSAAGVHTNRFEYLGFIPHKKGRQTMIEYMKNAEHTVACYESPHRILKTLEALQDCSKTIVLGRELTKKFEEFLRGNATELYQELSARDAIKGEFVLIVDAA